MKNVLKRGVTIYMTVIALLLSCLVGVPHTAYALENMYYDDASGFWYSINEDGNTVTIQGDWGDDDSYSKMTKAIFPSAIDGRTVTKIYGSVFYRRVNLQEVYIPNTVTRIGSQAFVGCLGLDCLVIPPSVTEIGDDICLGCSKITVYYPSTLQVDYLISQWSNISYTVQPDNTVALTIKTANPGENIAIPEVIAGYKVSSVTTAEDVTTNFTITCDKHRASGWTFDKDKHFMTSCTICHKTNIEGSHTYKNGNTACECGYIPYTYTAAKQDATLDYGYATGATLSVDVKPTLGNEQITYQWYENDTVIAGASGASYTMPTGKGVGSYTYYCKMDCGGYQVDGEKSTIVIGKKNITVQADSLTKVAGEENPALIYTVPRGALVAGDTTADWTVNLTTTATKDSPVGEYPITGTITSEKYNVTVTPGVLTVVATEEEKDYVNPEVQVPQKGDKFKDAGNKAVYKVTKAGTVAGGVGAVEYTKPVKKTAKTVTIPSTITVGGIKYKVTSIAKNAFKNNKKITKVKIGKYVKTIGANAFYKCTKLKSVTLGKSVATIGDKAFYKCTALTKITLPSKVAKIGKQAFYGCKKLKTITVKTKKLISKKMGKQVFKGIHAKATIKVPKSKYKAYKTLFKKAEAGKKVKYKKF